MRALVVVLYLLNVSYALCAFYMYIYTEHLLGVVAGADRDSGETDTSYLICNIYMLYVSFTSLYVTYICYMYYLHHMHISRKFSWRGAWW